MHSVSQNKTLGFNIPENNEQKRMGIILRMARVAQGLEMRDLSRQLNLSRESIRRFETGERTIDAVTLGRLAEALNQDVNLFWS